VTLTGLAFLFLLALHLAAALLLNLRGQRKTVEQGRETRLYLFPLEPFIVLLMKRISDRKPAALAMAAVQSALFLFAFILGAKLGVFSRALVSPLNIGLGLLVAHAIFGISLAVTHRSVGDVAGHLLDVGPLWDYVVEHPRVLLQFMTVAVAEEVIYRVGAQPLLIQLFGGPVAGILAAAAAFSVVHDHFFKNSVGQSLEFLAFSILLGVLFYWTGSLILIIVIHAVRNIEIAYIEHLGRVEEHGGSGFAGDNAADLEEEFMSGESSIVMVVTPGGDLPVSCFQYRPEIARSVKAEPVVNHA
jgi:membrane protease YdiL (CAAX protease family)